MSCGGWVLATGSENRKSVLFEDSGIDYPGPELDIENGKLRYYECHDAYDHQEEKKVFEDVRMSETVLISNKFK